MLILPFTLNIIYGQPFYKIEKYLGEDKSVVVSSPWFWDGVLHGVEEQYRHDLGDGATWCRMSGNKDQHLSNSKNQTEWILSS